MATNLKLILICFTALQCFPTLLTNNISNNGKCGDCIYKGGISKAELSLSGNYIFSTIELGEGLRSSFLEIEDCKANKENIEIKGIVIASIPQKERLYTPQS